MALFSSIKGGARTLGTGTASSSMAAMGRSTEQLKNTGVVMNMFAGAKSFAKAMFTTGDYTSSLRQSMFRGSKGQEYLRQIRRFETTPKGQWTSAMKKDFRGARKGALAESVGMTGTRGVSKAVAQKETMMRIGQGIGAVGMYGAAVGVSDTDFTTKLGFGAGYAYGLSKFRGSRAGGLKALGMGFGAAMGVAPFF